MLGFSIPFILALQIINYIVARLICNYHNFIHNLLYFIINNFTSELALPRLINNQLILIKLN
jgi:hypothetical protein